ncbi:MAG TPA: methyltransferase domain-containing protein [Candidatus Binataceae bacterium]|nr:methyltransferase domain-containing protein [Candidatus Binataceae bacterium]
MPETLDPSRNWDEAAAGWTKWWPTFEQAAQVVSNRLIEMAGIQSGGRVLDIATGIGEPAVSAARKVGPKGKVLAVDHSTGMLQAARHRAAQLGLTNIEFRQLDAESIALPEHDFNAILSRWGLMFLPDLTGALGRMRTLLADGGRLAAAVWGTPDKVPMISLAGETVRKIANLPPPPPGSPDPCRLCDRVALARSFKDAGFSDFVLEPMNITYEFKSPEEFAQFRYDVATPFRTMVDKLDSETRKRVMDAVLSEARRFVKDGGLRLDNETICVSARK